MTRHGLADWDDAVAVLRAADEVALACHVNPDGDSLGSLLGLALGLRTLGKRVHVSIGDEPLVVPASLSFLPGTDLLVEPARVPQCDTFVALDCGAGDRLGALEAPARAARHLINIDHHPGNDDFGTLNLVAPEASCTAELVTELLRDLDVALDADIATCLYTGVVTDTGRFQYPNSSPDTLRLAADLLAYGVPAPAIAEEVFESSPFGYLKLVGIVLARAVLIPEERFVYSWVTLDDLGAAGIAPTDTDKLIDLVRATRDADVAAILKEQPDGTYRVSLRSRGPSVGAIARANGGGGHELAAGFTAPSRDEAVAAIRGALGAAAAAGASGA